MYFLYFTLFNKIFVNNLTITFRFYLFYLHFSKLILLI